MNKRLLSFFAVLIVALFLVNSVSAAKVAYIVKDNFPLNIKQTYTVNILRGEGHSVEVYDRDVILNAGAYDLIIVGDDVLDIPFDNARHKTLFLGQSAAKYSGLGRYSGITTGDKILLENKTHEIIKGFPAGARTIYPDYQSISYVYGCLAVGSKSLAYKTYTSKSSLLALDKNSLLLDQSLDCSKRNRTLYERNVFFGMPQADKWNTDAKILFINSVEWVLHGSDKDGDGFYSDLDCNDNDTGINPDASEVPYNRIDEDCSDLDLADADNDGYCKQGYAIINMTLQCPKESGLSGTDCNDNATSINPGSLDVYKNCRNDAPMISSMAKITLYEPEVAKIEISAIDPEGDLLNYTINDSRLVQDNETKNVFRWQTDYYDFGTYSFRIRVSDGSLANESEVIVEVKNKNQAPYCDAMPVLEWNEDTNASIDLNDYCRDLDNDSLHFYINNTSPYDYVTLDYFEDGKANFSSKKDWNGQDWILFLVSDGKESYLTDRLVLEVLPVNDAVILKRSISDISWDEDVNLTNHINLNDYFFDSDGDWLNFSVLGNHFITLVINNGLVSFYPAKDWNGNENVIFSASDGNYSVNSNAVSLIVNPLSEPPEFGPIECNSSILEDTESSCTLMASDIENDTFAFSVAGENKLHCRIDGNSLRYFPYEDHNGDASCILSVSDAYGHSDLVFRVNVLSVNDAPAMNNYSPGENPRIMNGTSNQFSVSASDVDSAINISWLVDGNVIGFGPGYLFNMNRGLYNLTALASDGELYASHSWNVFVGDISEFRCSEVNGYSCGKKETCMAGNTLNVADSNIAACCSVPCTPALEDIDRCSYINESVEITIRDPDADDKFEMNSTISVRIEIRNNAGEDLDFDLEAYLYDLSDDDEAASYEESLSIDDSKKDSIEFDLPVPADLDDGDDYILFVKAEDGSYCNEKYIPVKIERKKHELVIDKFSINPSNAECGEILDAEIRIRNRGTKNEDAYLVFESKGLNISEKTGEFEIEKYGKDDNYKHSFSIKVPGDVKEGKYNITARALYNGQETSIYKEISAICRTVEFNESITGADPIIIENNGEKVMIEDKADSVIIIMVVLVFADLLILFIIKYFLI